jgi:hypothetical protein
VASRPPIRRGRLIAFFPADRWVVMVMARPASDGLLRACVIPKTAEMLAGFPVDGLKPGFDGLMV